MKINGKGMRVVYRVRILKDIYLNVILSTTLLISLRIHKLFKASSLCVRFSIAYTSLNCDHPIIVYIFE